MLRSPGATAAQLAVTVGISPSTARRALDRLEVLGMLSRRGTPPRFMAAAPDMAIDALVLRRREELERCRIAAASLLSEYREGAQRPASLVEVIVGREATFQRYVQLLTTAREEVLMFDKPPYIGPADNPLELDVLGRGVTWRAVYAPEGLELPERIEQLAIWQQAGEQARVCAQVPLKLVMVDRSLALLPLAADHDAAEHTAILVHPCSLLTTLGMLFDILWQRSLPLRWAERHSAAEQELSEFDGTLLRLLSVGSKDQAIARQLGVSVRTVRRRLTNLMTSYGVTSRFQLGQLAARSDWI